MKIIEPKAKHTETAKREDLYRGDEAEQTQPQPNPPAPKATWL